MQNIVDIIEAAVSVLSLVSGIYIYNTKKSEDKINLIDKVVFDNNEENINNYTEYVRKKYLKKFSYTISNKYELSNGLFRIDLSRAVCVNIYCIILLFFVIGGDLFLVIYTFINDLNSFLSYYFELISIFVAVLYCKIFWAYKNDFIKLKKFYGEDKILFINTGKLSFWFFKI